MTVLKVAGFALLIIGFFTGFANSLPQFKTAPPEVIEIKEGEVTIEQMISIGKTRFETVCMLCHNPALGGRAPEPAGIAGRAAERPNDPNYKNPDVNGTGGKAASAEEYLRESMICPSCFVVPGFGVKGSNDMTSPMPVINKPPTAFSDFEINSVIAYLQSKDGFEVTIKPPTGKAPKTEEKPKGPVIADNPKDLVMRLGCSICHPVGNLTPPVALGPDLKTVGERRDGPFIRQSILEPDAVITEGFLPGIMPKDFPNKMTVGEFEMLVKFLANSKGQGEF